jgi:hypothetical protein
MQCRIMSAEEADPQPTSLRQKRVLDVAAEHPDASLEELASMVPSATTDMVERVLDDFGDPAAEANQDKATPADSSPADTPSTDEEAEVEAPGSVGEESETPATTDAVAGDSSRSDDEATPGRTFEDLPEKQRELLSFVAEDPSATQEEIGDRLGVTRATVSRRATDIPGLEWTDRERFVETVMNDVPMADVSTDGGSTSEGPAASSGSTTTVAGTTGTSEGESSRPAADDPDPGMETAALAERVDRLESKLAELDSNETAGGVEAAVADPELLHKVVHACMASEAIDADEELQILRDLLS